MKWTFLTVLCIASLAAFGQEQVKIEKADELKFKKTETDQIQRLLGNVILSHDSVIMYCDSAHFYSKRNSFNAFGNVRMIRDGNTLYCDSLLYKGNKRSGRAMGEVRLVEEEMTMNTDLLFFSRNSKQVWYNSGANIEQSEGHLYSKKGTYFTEQGLFHFSDSVRIKQEDYYIETDSMHHWSDLEVSMFFGPTHIETDSQDIVCGYGWFDGKTESLRGGRGVVSRSQGRYLRSDSLYYDGVDGWIYAWQNVFLSDTNKNMRISTPYLEFNEKEFKGKVGLNGMLARLEEGDTAYLTADIILIGSTAELGTSFWAYNDVRIFRVDFQARCDSMVYHESDSMIQMFERPILWSESSQVTADSINVFINDSAADRIELIDNCFVLSEDGPLQFNQLKGKYMLGFFRENDIRKILVYGNGESIYYARDEKQELMGINKVICSDLTVWLKSGEVEQIQFQTKPDGTLFPEDQLTGPDRKLRGYEDRFDEQPTDPYQMRKWPQQLED